MPGHLPLLVSAKGLLDSRVGHTELSIALAQFASIVPILVISELIDFDTGNTMDKKKSLEIADRYKTSCVYGRDVLTMWKKEKIGE